MYPRIALLFLFALFINRPTAEAQINWGVQAGINNSFTTGIPQYSTPVSSLTAVQAAAFSIFPLHKRIYVKPSIGYSPKGFRYKSLRLTDALGNLTAATTGNLVYRFDYVQLSLPIVFKLGSNGKVHGFAGGGPYLAYAAGGKQKITNFKSSDPGTVKPSPVNISFTQQGFKRFDAGINMQLSIILQKHWYGGINVDAGITRTNNKGSGSYRNTNISLGIGYVFK